MSFNSAPATPERNPTLFKGEVDNLRLLAEDSVGDLNDLHHMYDLVSGLKFSISRRISESYKNSTVSHWDDKEVLRGILEKVKADGRLNDADTLEGKGERQNTIDFIEKLIRDGDPRDGHLERRGSS